MNTEAAKTAANYTDAGEPLAPKILEPIAPPPIPEQTPVAPVDESPASVELPTKPKPKSKPRKQRKMRRISLWSQEKREAQAQRMRDRHAAKKQPQEPALT